MHTALDVLDVIGDPWPEEPDEPLIDKYRDSDVEGSGTPEDRLLENLPDESEVDPELFRTFWGVVAAANLGLLAVSLGFMLIGFRGEWRNGGILFFVGVAAFWWGWIKYRSYMSTEPS